MKKHFLTLFALALLFCFASQACADRAVYPELGLSWDEPTQANNIYLQSAAYTELQTGVSVFFYNYDATDPFYTAYQQAALTGTAEEQQTALNAYLTQRKAHYQHLGSVIGYQTDRLSQVSPEDLEGAVLLGTNNAYTYYLIKENENKLLAEEDKPLLEAARAEAQKLLDSVTIIDYAVSSAATDSKVLGSFSTVDMDGNPVDQSVFAGADLTVVHVWGTYCNPCINEMPRLAEWAKTLPENVQLIGLICDVQSASDKSFKTAEKILSKSGVSFTNILTSQDLIPFLQTVSGVPTTFFLDSNGNQVAEPVLGAYLEKYKQTVNDFLAK